MDRNTYQNHFQTLFFAAIFSFLLAAVAFGQDETTAVGRSQLAGVRVPAGAARVNDGQVPAEIADALDKFIAEGGGKVRKGETEVLVWTGSDLKRTGSKAIVSGVADSLKSDGWLYEIGGSADGITVFSALKDGSTRRALIGFYGEMDGTLVFAWAEMHRGDAPHKTVDVPITSTGGNVDDYSFTAPSGWSRSDASGKIVLTRGESTITFLPPVASSGDLERDAERIIWQVFKGCDAWYANGFTADYGVFEKGRTAQGLEYFSVYRYAKKAGDENNGLAQSKFDAVLLLVNVGDKVAVAAGRSPFQSQYYDESAAKALDLILYDLKFKGVTASYDVKKDLLGSWATASTTVGLAYTFNANGSFNKGAVAEFRTSRDRYTDNVTTTSYGLTETYSLAGNVMTQNYKRNGQTTKHKVRVYHTKYDKDAWQHKLGFLPVENPEGGTIVFKRS